MRAARLLGRPTGPRRRPEGRVRAGLTGALLTACGLCLTWGAAGAEAAPPPMSRHEIIARAESAIGTSYTWGRESWAPHSTGAGPDCSGLILKCWEVPRTMLYQEEDGVTSSISPRYTTYSLMQSLGPWGPLSSRSQLLPGDILVYNDGTSGHVVLYAQGDGWNYPVVYEAPYTGARVRRAARYLGSTYQPRRRDGLSDSSIVIDNPTAESVGGTDIGGSWKRSANVAGYYGHDYQVQRGSAGVAWARWTPRLPASGYYNVYVRWPGASDRASNARIQVNGPTYTATRWIDQRGGTGSWYKLGRYYLSAGYSPHKGSVTLHATGANGYVVADAVLFAPTK